jgi:hypothetical protein
VSAAEDKPASQACVFRNGPICNGLEPFSETAPLAVGQHTAVVLGAMPQESHLQGRKFVPPAMGLDLSKPVVAIVFERTRQSPNGLSLTAEFSLKILVCRPRSIS